MRGGCRRFVFGTVSTDPCCQGKDDTFPYIALSLSHYALHREPPSTPSHYVHWHTKRRYEQTAIPSCVLGRWLGYSAPTPQPLLPYLPPLTWSSSGLHVPIRSTHPFHSSLLECKAESWWRGGAIEEHVLGLQEDVAVDGEANAGIGLDSTLLCVSTVYIADMNRKVARLCAGRLRSRCSRSYRWARSSCTCPAR